MTVQANKVKHIFAPIKGKQLSTLSWESPPDPPAVLKRKAAEQAAAQHSRKRLAVSTPLVNSQPDMHNQSEVLPPPPEPITATAAAHKKEKKPSKQQQQEHDRKGTATQNLSLAQNAEDKSEKADVQPESSSSSDAGVVDFMSDDDDDAVAEGQYTNAAQGTALGAVHSIHADMSRFSSDDEEAQQAKHATEGSFRQQQTRLSRFASLDDEPDGGTAYQAPTTASLSHTAEGVDLSRVDSDDDKAAPASQAGAAVTVAAQLTVMQAATNQHTDLSRFNSDSDSENEVGPSASNAPAVKTDVSVGAAGETTHCDGV